MLDVKYLRDHIDEVKERIGTRGTAIDWESFLELDAVRRELLQEVESLRCQRNEVSEKIASMKKEKKDASQEIENMRLVSQRIKELDGVFQDREAALKGLILTIPNVPHASVAVGKSSADNPEIRRWGELPRFTFEPQPHWDIGENLGVLDFDRGAKITGARFTLYCGAGAQLERALINFMLDLHTREHHYLDSLYREPGEYDCHWSASQI
jgi:seryl-tRNA synthetase